MHFRQAAFAVLALFGLPAAALQATAAIPVPAGFGPGDTYHLLFNSSTFTNALSSDINFYNGFVQAAADAAGVGTSEGLTWKAIASTSAVDARVNAVVGANTPVFNMRQGQLEQIADGFSDLWDGALDGFAAYNERGQLNAVDAWTGSLASGLRAPGSTLGHSSGTAWCGRPTQLNSNWLTFIEPSTLTQLPVYALSAAITLTDADFNQDERIDGGDFLVWQRGRGGPASLATGDADGSGSVNRADLAIWERGFGGGSAGSTIHLAAVPEPSAAALAAWAAVVFTSRRARQRSWMARGD
jgi:hypothetical protein